MIELKNGSIMDVILFFLDGWWFLGYSDGKDVNLVVIVVVAVLDVEAFERLLGPCMNVMKRNIDDYEDQLVRIFGSRVNISDIR